MKTWAILLMLASPVLAETKPFRIAGFYSIGALNNSLYSYGAEMNCITKARIEDARKEGINLYYESFDLKWSPITAALLSKQIAQDNNFDVVVGAILSTEAAAASPILRDAEIPLVTPTATNPVITEENPFALRIAFSDRRQAELLAKYTAREIKPKRIAVIRNSSNLYSEFLAKEYEAKLATLSPDTKVFAHIILDDFGDFDALMKRVLEDRVDMIFAPLMEPQLAPIYASLVRQGASLILLGSDSIDGRPEFVKAFGPLSPKIRFVYSSYWNKKLSGPFANKFQTLRRHHCSQYPISSYSVVAFDAVNLVIETLKKYPTATRGELVRRMKALKLKGVAGPLVFGKTNDPLKPIYLLEVKGDLKISERVFQ